MLLRALWPPSSREGRDVEMRTRWIAFSSLLEEEELEKRSGGSSRERPSLKGSVGFTTVPPLQCAVMQ